VISIHGYKCYKKDRFVVKEVRQGDVTFHVMGDRLLVSKDMQFSSKVTHSTSMCSMILKETIKHYHRNNSTVYCVALDAIKAFDRVNYVKLVWLLLKEQLLVIIIRILLNMYLSHFTSVTWNCSHSLTFRVLNGVRQGAILTPLYLVSMLTFFYIECHFGLRFAGAFAYADDLVLNAPSANAIWLMLQVCDDCATQYNVSFNATKSKCLPCPHLVLMNIYSMPSTLFRSIMDLRPLSSSISGCILGTLQQASTKTQMIKLP
jgi:hypothetical protein